MEELFKDIHVGDKVMCRHVRFGVVMNRVCEVKSITKTQIMLVGSDKKYRRIDGSCIGDYCGYRLYPYTEEAGEKAKSEEIRRKARMMITETMQYDERFNKLTDDDLKVIIDVIKKKIN